MQLLEFIVMLFSYAIKTYVVYDYCNAIFEKKKKKNQILALYFLGGALMLAVYYLRINILILLYLWQLRCFCANGVITVNSRRLCIMWCCLQLCISCARSLLYLLSAFSSRRIMRLHFRWKYVYFLLPEQEFCFLLSVSLHSGLF